MWEKISFLETTQAICKYKSQIEFINTDVFMLLYDFDFTLSLNLLINRITLIDYIKLKKLCNAVGVIE